MDVLFFDNPELVDPSNYVNDEKIYKEILAQNILKFLLVGKYDDLGILRKTWFDRQVWSGIFTQKDPHMLYQLRCEMRKAWLHLYNKLSLPRDAPVRGRSHDELNISNKIVDLNIINSLSLYVMLEPTPHDGELKIPRLDRKTKQYQLISHSLTPLELKPLPILRMQLQDKDRVFAYGLTPINLSINPILIFMGTTFPTGQGAMSQDLINKYPYASVGEMYDWTSVINWVNSSSKDHKINVCGISQGGSLGLLLALAIPDKLSRVDVVNPPGMLTNYDQHHPIYWKWDLLEQTDQDRLPEVLIQRQHGDPVSPMGYWKDNWKILKIDIPVFKVLLNNLFKILLSVEILALIF